MKKHLTSLSACRGRGVSPQWRMPLLLLVSLILLLQGGCATWQTPGFVDDAGLRERAVSKTAGNVRLSAAVLSAADSQRLLGADVNAKDIQPVWIEVENSSPDTLWLLRAGTDPDYFSPLEAAWTFHTPLSGRRNDAIDEHFDALDFSNPIPPRSTRSGIIFTNPHQRIRMLNVDLLGPERMVPFTLFLPDPDNPPDENAIEAAARLLESARVDIQSPDKLRSRLRNAPCCATAGGEDAAGDPVNVVLIGTFDNVASALIRRGFRSDRKELDDTQRLFGRLPDFVLRKSVHEGLPAHWMRGWVAPFLYRGQPVWLVQAGRPIGGRSAIDEERALVLHPDVDEARNLLIQDLIYSGGIAKLGFVRGAGAVRTSRTQNDKVESGYHTDGLRAVMFILSRPRALSDFEILDWVPALQRREADAAREQADALR
ncbi:MAG: LssY C-terminal domain-containing protein [Gammaproteobacteria bacterium]